MAKLLDLIHCRGCEDDFYTGNNGLGVKECWRRRGALFGKYRLIPIDLRPPYLDLPLKKLPRCYWKKGYVKVEPGALNSEGCWR